MKNEDAVYRDGNITLLFPIFQLRNSCVIKISTLINQLSIFFIAHGSKQNTVLVFSIFHFRN